MKKIWLEIGISSGLVLIMIVLILGAQMALPAELRSSGIALIVLLFVNFTAYNWRCPSCRKYLGSDIGRHSCRNCGVRLR